MSRSRLPAPAALACTLLVLLAVPSMAQMSQSAREAMWPAPTAEDWARPCGITWQRSWEDAVAVSQETGKAILVCVNMDGEIASEHYAGIRYRQPEITALYEPYVCVIASVYRHSPRDYDEDGRRVECPRFGTVTCGEHIALEPIVYEKYLDGRRIAPRHIMVELDGSEVYDVFYAFDTQSVFDAIEQGIAEREHEPTPVVRGDRSLLEKVASRDVVDREEVEAAYESGDAATRKALLEAALETGADAPVDLLRQGIYGFDTELAGLAREALAAADDPGAIDLIPEALQVALGSEERERLVGALERLGQTSTKARAYASVHRGLSTGTGGVLDAEGWARALQGVYESSSGEAGAPSASPAARDALVESQDAILDGEDADALVDLAEAFLDQSYEQVGVDEEFVQLLLMDARDTATRARELGAEGWRVSGVLAIAEHYLGNEELAKQHAQTAVRTGVPADATSWNAMAVLALFAGSRQAQIDAALQAKEPWPPEWLTDVHTACQLLLRHPHGTVEQALAYHDLLVGLSARREARQALDVALERWPGDAEVHDRLRRTVLRERRLVDLTATYDALLAAPDASPELHWHAGQAALTVAEFHRRRSREEPARAAYARAITHFEDDIAAFPELREEADRFVARALAGQARLSLLAEDDARALDELLAAWQRAPSAAGDLDGLNLSGIDTAKMLLARFRASDDAESVERLETAMAALPPDQLEKPAYETERDASGNPVPMRPVPWAR